MITERLTFQASLIYARHEIIQWHSPVGVGSVHASTKRDPRIESDT